MKKIILLIGICGMMRGNGYGQQTEKNASVNIACPPIWNIYPDVQLSLFFDSIGLWNTNSCFGIATGEEIITRFKPHCTNVYVLQLFSNDIDLAYLPVSIKVSTGFCDSTGYTCLTPYYTDPTVGYWQYNYYLTVDSSFTYDLLFDNDWINGQTGYVGVNIFTPHVSNVHFFDITPDSVSVSWDGTFDDMVMEYGPKDFIPGSDTIPGTNGILFHNPASPYTFTGLIPDSTYDFYFRDKCGATYSVNSSRYRQKTALNCDSLPIMTCNGGNYFFTNYNFSAIRQGSWNLGPHCGCIMTSPEKIWSFTPDTSGIYTIYKPTPGFPFPFLSFYYKEASLGCNEHNWTYIACGCGYCSLPWAYTFGPLTAGTNYYIMVNGTQDNCVAGGGTVTPHFELLCPYTCYTPLQPGASSITATTVNISSTCFLCNGNKILEYGLTGFTPGTDSLPGIGGTVTQILNVTGLNPGTTYDFYLREFCDTAGVYSDNSVVRTVTTLPLCSTAPLSINSNATNNTICSGQTVTLTQVGGVLSANGAFYWYADSCGGASLGTGYSNIFSPTITITYYVRAEDTCGVTACASITITVNPSPAPPTITGDTTICAGTSTVLTASGGYACYLWSMASTTQSVNVSNAGVYMVTVCDVNGCTASASATVIIYPLPIATIAGNTSICTGNTAAITILFTGTQPFVYSYTDGTTTFGPFTTSASTAIINVSPNVTTTYTLINLFYDANCQGIIGGSATVIVNPNPVAVITPSVTTNICLGDTVHFTANTGTGFIYQWYKNSLPISGALNSFYDAVATGNYSFALTDSSGCYSLSASTHVQIICLPIDSNIDLRTGFVSDDHIVLIPNPASNELTIQTGRVLQSIKIFDMVGQKVYSNELPTPNSTLLTKINISNFSKGIYFVEINDGKQKSVRKFLKE